MVGGMGESGSGTLCQSPSVRRGWEGAELCSQWKLHRAAEDASRAEQRLAVPLTPVMLIKTGLAEL